MTAVAPSAANSRSFEPLAQGWRSFAWSGGSFDAAFRPPTREVEGRLTLRHPTIITIVDGGCRSTEVISDCGHTYEGADFAGSVSFVPPTCSRQVKMRDVRLAWASLSLRPDFFSLGEERGDAPPAPEVNSFTNQRDGFLHSLLLELLRLQRSEDLDSLYCEAMAVSAAQYLLRRHGGIGRPRALGRMLPGRMLPGRMLPGRMLPGWRLRRVTDYVQANLGNQDLRLDDLARTVGLSTGFFHRAFKEATGETPLAYIQRLRVQRGMQLLLSSELSVLQVALQVGFLSPSHFCRLFQRQVGMTPSQYRKGRH